MSRRWILLAGVVMAAATTVALAQTGERPRPKLFGGAGKSTPAKSNEDARRRVEIDVELAWLADPITFPYFLEARVEGTTLTARGFVPDKAVHEHALKLARLQAPYTVADALKEHPSLLVRIAKESPAQLKSAVTAALREALPRQYKNIQIECGADGMVALRGSLATAEDKLSASHALRRLYGCTRVQNLIRLPGMPEVVTAKPMPTPLAKDVAKSSSSSVVAKIGLPVPREETPPPPPKEEPAKTPPPPPAVAKEASKTPGNRALTAEKTSRLQKRILEACPGAKSIKIDVTPANKLQIELTVRSDDQITPFAGKIYNLPELVEMREDVELHFTVGQ